MAAAASTVLTVGVLIFFLASQTMADTFNDCSGIQVTSSVVVSANGDGDYKTLSEAVRNIPANAQGRYVIYVKAGIYDVGKQSVVISRSDVSLIGDGMGKTVIRSSLNIHAGQNIDASAAVEILANNFAARCISFENTSGPENEQAVALRSDGDSSVFYRCQFLGYQDTLYANKGRQFFRECDVEGSLDFIFGDARMVLQKCNIKIRRPRQGAQNVITAQGRRATADNNGIVIHCSSVGTAAGFKMGQQKGYLGRPWMAYSRVAVMKTFIDDVVDPAGWLAMGGNEGTAEYSEYDNSGPGASTAGRVKWPGYKAITNPSEAMQYTVGAFIDGGQWLSRTGIPFDLGLDCS